MFIYMMWKNYGKNRLSCFAGKLDGTSSRPSHDAADKKAFPENVLSTILKDCDKMASLVHTALKNGTENKETKAKERVGKRTLTPRDAKTFYGAQYLMTGCRTYPPKKIVIVSIFDIHCLKRDRFHLSKDTFDIWNDLIHIFFIKIFQSNQSFQSKFSTIRNLFTAI